MTRANIISSSDISPKMKSARPDYGSLVDQAPLPDTTDQEPEMSSTADRPKGTLFTHAQGKGIPDLDPDLIEWLKLLSM